MGPRDEHPQQEESQNTASDERAHGGAEVVGPLHAGQHQQSRTDTQQAPDAGSDPAETKLPAVAGLGTEVKVEVPNRDHGQAVDGGVQAGHGRRAHAGQDESGDSGGDRLHHEVGEDLGLLGRNFRRQLSGVNLVIGVEERADQQEEGPGGHDAEPAEQQRLLRGTGAGGGQVALGHVLAGGVVGPVMEESVENDHHNGWMGQVQGPIHQLELAGVPGDLKQVKGAAVRSKGQKPETEQPAAEQGDRLQYVGPDHGLQSSQHGVEESQDAAHNQNGHRVPSRHGVERLGHQEQDHSIAEEVVNDIDRRGVAAGAVPEALFQKFVGAHADPLPVVGNHPAGGQNSDDGENQVGEVGDPVAPEPLARKGQKGPGAD